jgi:DNA-binding CsgD family transcriptional regulator
VNLVDEIEALGEIYDAIGDAERWRRLEERLATVPQISAEIEKHVAIARRAHESRLTVSRQIELLSNVHNQITLGAILVDRNGMVARVNDTATHVLSDRDGLEVVDGRLRAIHRSDDARLTDAIARLASAEGAHSYLRSVFIRVTRPGRQPLIVLVVRQALASRSFLDDQSLAMLLVVDPDRTASPPIDTLRRLYGFTEREAEFAVLLMRGLDVKEAALALGVAVTTARTFLAQVRGKTDSHNQSELMLRLLAIPQVVR